MKYKAIIFDMDGTLLDTLDDLTLCINYALSKLNLKTRTKEEIKTFVFEALTNCLSSVAGGAKKEDCHWIIESDWLMVEVWFDADGKTIEVATRFVPQSGYKKFNYDKYKVLKHDNEVNPDF